MRVVILGAGSGAFAAAVDLKFRGFDVCVCSAYPADLAGRMKDISKQGGVNYSGMFGEGFLELETHANLSPVSTADVVMIVTLAEGYDYYATRCSGLLKEGQTVFLNPGYLGGGLAFTRTVKATGGRLSRIFETNNLPYISRFADATKVQIFRKSKLVFLSSFPSDGSESGSDIMRELYPEATDASSVLESGMMNPNVMVHPPGMLLNAGWIEATKGNFMFYNEGCSEGVSKVIEAIDAERIRICERLGVKTMSIGEYYRRNGYSDAPTTSVRDVLQHSEPNRNIRAPTGLDSRYVTEDIPFGLVPMSSFGKLAEVNTPIIDSLIELAVAMMGADLWSTGLTAAKMGIQGMNKDDLHEYLSSG